MTIHSRPDVTTTYYVETPRPLTRITTWAILITCIIVTINLIFVDALALRLWLDMRELLAPVLGFGELPPINVDGQTTGYLNGELVSGLSWNDGLGCTATADGRCVDYVNPPR